VKTVGESVADVDCDPEPEPEAPVEDVRSFVDELGPDELEPDDETDGEDDDS